MTTLEEFMEGPDWPKCENCKVKPKAMTISQAEMHNEEETLPSYGIPPWCSDCLEEVDWEDYWREQAKKQYQSGERQS